MSDKVETKIIQIMPAEPGWAACCYKVMGDDIQVVYQPLIGWALVTRRQGYESDMEGVPISETRVDPLFIEPDSSRPVIPSGLHTFWLYGVVGPRESRDEDEVVDAIRVGIEIRSNEE
jgi:hypothetical protein